VRRLLTTLLVAYFYSTARRVGREPAALNVRQLARLEVVRVRDLRVLELVGEIQPHGARLIVALAKRSVGHRADGRV
jgi:hypothetical protein